MTAVVSNVTVRKLFITPWEVPPLTCEGFALRRNGEAEVLVNNDR